MEKMKRPPKPDTKGVLGRLLKMLFREYPVRLIIVAICIALMSYVFGACKHSDLG